MAVKDLSATQIAALVGTRLAGPGLLVAAPYSADWYAWLINALIHLAEGSAAYALSVRADDGSATTVRIQAGRATLNGAALAYAGGTVNLSAHNNDVAYLWAYNSSGAVAIGYGADGSGWPAVPHLKLAEVTLSAGAITAILDRRSETLLRDNMPRLPVYSDSSRPAAGVMGRLIFNSDDGKINIDNGSNWTLPDGTTT